VPEEHGDNAVVAAAICAPMLPRLMVARALESCWFRCVTGESGGPLWSVAALPPSDAELRPLLSRCSSSDGPPDSVTNEDGINLTSQACSGYVTSREGDHIRMCCLLDWLRAVRTLRFRDGSEAVAAIDAIGAFATQALSVLDSISGRASVARRAWFDAVTTCTTHLRDAADSWAVRSVSKAASAMREEIGQFQCTDKPSSYKGVVSSIHSAVGPI